MIPLVLVDCVTVLTAMSCANVPATPVRMSVSRTSVSSPRPTGQVSVGICWHAQLEGRD